MSNTYQFQTIRSSLSTQPLLLSGEEQKEMREAEIPKLVFDSGTKLEGGKLFAASSSQETYMDSGMADEKRCCFNLISRHLLLRNQFQFPSFITNFSLSVQTFYISQTQSTAAERMRVQNEAEQQHCRITAISVLCF